MENIGSRVGSSVREVRSEKLIIDRVSPSLEMRFNLFFHIYRTVEDYSKMDVKGRIVGGNSRKYIPIQSASEPVIRNTVQLPAMSYQEYLKKKGIPGYDNMSSEVIFPNEREAPSPSVEEPSNSVENDGAKSEWKVWRKDKIAFFPEVILYFHGRNANPYKTIFKILIARISGKSRQRIIPVPIPLRFSTRIVVTPLIKRTNRSSPTNKYLVKRNSSKILSS